MKIKIWILAVISPFLISAQHLSPVDYYISAYNEIAPMLSGKKTVSIKRAVYLSEWAYYEGDLDYKLEFCDEIDRIVKFIERFYDANELHNYRTGKQMALNEYFFRPYSGNGYKPYLYDYENFFKENENWENQFVSKVLNTHKGQCHSLPMLYKILANEIGANVAISKAPGHSYIMYKDLDKQTPEEWINLELTSHQMIPSFWIKENSEINDSAVIVGTYMTPLTDKQTVACQLSDLAFGYYKKFGIYDEFTLLCTTKSLEYYPQNPNAIIIRGKSLEMLIRYRLMENGNVVDSYVQELNKQIEETYNALDNTYWTQGSEDLRLRMQEQAKDAERYINGNLK